MGDKENMALAGVFREFPLQPGEIGTHRLKEEEYVFTAFDRIVVRGPGIVQSFAQVGKQDIVAGLP